MSLSAKKIRNIDRESVHKICSGQVVLTLGTAVKELVENSLDASATNIEVRLKGYGQESIEVVDNGQGVEEANFEGLTLKHHTSKLRDFHDLTELHTFGFRGEALSSLCALGEVSIVTRHQTSPVATRLQFDHQGHISCQSTGARLTGTTVIVQNIFSTLAVRHKEFQRNIKKEYVKMMHILTAYAVVSTGVRITCTNQLSSSKNKQVMLSTGGGETLRENMSCVFGVKQVKLLMDFDQMRPSADVCEDMNIKLCDDDPVGFRVTGLVSPCQHGEGRSAPDRQFYFINQRPCDPTQIAKVVNEVYHTYNRHQYPAVVLHILIDADQLDVNVTPDKRKVFVNDEKILLAVIKTSLIKIYEPTCSTYGLNVPQPLHSLLTKERLSASAGHVSLQESGTQRPTLANLKRSFCSAFSKSDSLDVKTPSAQLTTPKQLKLTEYLDTTPERSPLSTQTHCAYSTDILDTRSVTNEPEMSESISSKSHQNSHHQRLIPQLDAEDNEPSTSCSPGCEVKCLCGDGVSEATKSCDKSRPWCEICNTHRCNCIARVGDNESAISARDNLISFNEDLLTYKSQQSSGSKGAGTQHTTLENTAQPDTQKTDATPVDQRREPLLPDERLAFHASQGDETGTESRSSEDIIIAYDEVSGGRRPERQVHFSMDELKQRFSSLKCSANENSNFCRAFRAKIAQDDNQAAEAELQKEIHKEMFADMEVLGQFNLGFIVAKLDNDLFIVDQHASDEKYNFEQLQSTVVLGGQKLIAPQRLELTASNETILIDNLNVFRQNGFELTVDEQAPPTQRVSLVSVPVSKNWIFGTSDIEEMIFVLTESPGVVCRPSRIRQMFASRACRMSIMIGTALDKAEMKKVLKHMGEIEQPWNCPHGRPTMRHLLNLLMLPSHPLT